MGFTPGWAEALVLTFGCCTDRSLSCPPAPRRAPAVSLTATQFKRRVRSMWYAVRFQEWAAVAPHLSSFAHRSHSTF